MYKDAADWSIIYWPLSRSNRKKKHLAWWNRREKCGKKAQTMQLGQRIYWILLNLRIVSLKLERESKLQFNRI